MRKIKINKGDRWRVLLTELLPYERPLLLSNVGYYDVMRSSHENLPPLLAEVLKNEKPTRPYVYSIRRNEDKVRQLGWMHPASQVPFVSFYEKYAQVLIFLCGRGPVSLRSPYRVANAFVERDLMRKNEVELRPDVEAVGSEFDPKDLYASSYFTYHKHTLLYKYFDSYDFHRLEKKYPYLMLTDINKCFDSIYSHSLAWAVKGKEFSKKAIGKESFEDLFDTIIRNCRDAQTDGIIIGPEVSRIYAEVILQHVDLKILAVLEERKLKHGLHFDLRRYVDDYFVFAKNAEILEEVRQAVTRCLREYHMHLSDSKTSVHRRPYTSNIQVAKERVSRIVQEYFDKYVLDQPAADNETEQEDLELEVQAGPASSNLTLRSINRPSHLANTMIAQIKRAVFSSDGAFENVVSYILGQIKRRLARLIYYRSVKGTDEAAFVNFIGVLLDVAFFLLAMDCRVRNTYQIAQIVVMVMKPLRSMSIEAQEVVKKRIYDELLLLLRNRKEDECRVEVLNLFVILGLVGGNKRIDEADLKELMLGASDRELVGLSYFEIVTAMHVIRDEARYSGLRDGLLAEVERRMTLSKDTRLEADTACLFLDLIACPFLTSPQKQSLIRAGLATWRGQKTVNTVEATQVERFCQDKHWFMDWSGEVNIELLLQRTEINTPYE